MSLTPNELLFDLSGGANNSTPLLSIGGAASTHKVSSNSSNNLFDDISNAQAMQGYTDYRCIYLENTSDSEILSNAKVFISAIAGTGASIGIGCQFQTEVQTVLVNGIAYGGNFTFTYNGWLANAGGVVYTFGDVTLWAQSFQRALNAIPELGDVIVTGVRDSITTLVTFRITFSGSAGNRAHPLIQIVNNSLFPNTPPIVVSRVQQGGPINAVVNSLENKFVAPSIVTFVSSNVNNPLVIGDLRPGESFALWIKRFVPPGTLSLPGDGFSLTFSGDGANPVFLAQAAAFPSLQIDNGGVVPDVGADANPALIIPGVGTGNYITGNPNPSPGASFPINGMGWTNIPLAAGKNVYVSSSTGVDGTGHGLTSLAPAKTLAFGMNLISDEAGDRLLLRSGDTWQNTVTQADYLQLTKSGLNENNPLVITSYGAGDRPILRCGYGSALGSGGDPVSTPTIHDIMIVGLNFVAPFRDPNIGDFNPDSPLSGENAISINRPHRNVVIEDCSFSLWKRGGLIAWGENVSIRRCQFLDMWGINTYEGQGLYVQNSDEVLIEDNIFDKCGWNSDVPSINPVQSDYRHAIYCHQSCGPHLIVRTNYTSRNSGSGIQVRCGGQVYNNLMYDNRRHILIGGYNASVQGNIMIGGHDASLSFPLPIGVTSDYLAPGPVGISVIAESATISGNIFLGEALVDGQLAGQPAIDVTTNNSYTPILHARTYAMQNNITWDWPGMGLRADFAPSSLIFQHNALNGLTGFVIYYNALEGVLMLGNNHYQSSMTDRPFWLYDSRYTFANWQETTGDDTSVLAPATGYPSPTYYQGIDFETFSDNARTLNKNNWVTAYTPIYMLNQIRGSFGLGTV